MLSRVLTQYPHSTHTVPAQYSHSTRTVLTQYLQVSRQNAHRHALTCTHTVPHSTQTVPAGEKQNAHRHALTRTHTVPAKYSHSTRPVLTQYPHVSRQNALTRTLARAPTLTHAPKLTHARDLREHLLVTTPAGAVLSWCMDRD